MHTPPYISKYSGFNFPGLLPKLTNLPSMLSYFLFCYSHLVLHFGRNCHNCQLFFYYANFSCSISCLSILALISLSIFALLCIYLTWSPVRQLLQPVLQLAAKNVVAPSLPSTGDKYNSVFASGTLGILPDSYLVPVSYG